VIDMMVGCIGRTPVSRHTKSGLPDSVT